MNGDPSSLLPLLLLAEEGVVVVAVDSVAVEVVNVDEPEAPPGGLV